MREIGLVADDLDVGAVAEGIFMHIAVLRDAHFGETGATRERPTPEISNLRHRFRNGDTREEDGEDIVHNARIITYADIKKTRVKLVSLLTNDMNMSVEDIVGIYRRRWEIELLFKQLKQNFPLRYFYGESANAKKIKIQIWVTLITNLLLMAMQKRIKRAWSFSALATMVRIMLMYYLNPYSFFEYPKKDWLKILAESGASPPEQTLFDEIGGLLFEK